MQGESEPRKNADLAADVTPADPRKSPDLAVDLMPAIYNLIEAYSIFVK